MFAPLLQLEEEMNRAYRQSFIGETLPVLFEESAEIDGVTYQTGHTPNYIKAAVVWKEGLSNQVKNVCFRKTGKQEMFGDLRMAEYE